MPHNGPYVAQRGATIDVWQEPSGHWSARVSVRIPAMADWLESATAFHNANEALAWGRERIDLAMSTAAAGSTGPRDRDYDIRA